MSRAPSAALRNRNTSGRRLSPCIGVALLALALGAPPVLAQQPPEPANAASEAPPSTTASANATPSEADSGPVEAPESTEQGHTQLPESFERRPLEELLHESRLVGVRDTTFNVQLRSFYLHHDNFNNTEQLASTAGGSAGFKTGYFYEHFAFGATGYTSQKLHGPLDKDGTDLLEPGQRSYSVIGEAYGEALLTEGVKATAGRRSYDTPYLNGNDSRMTPATFQGYTILGSLGGGDGPALRFGAGSFDKEKQRNSEDFVSMATIAGAPAGVERGVQAAGANFSVGKFSIGAMDYFCRDIINIAYAESKYAVALADRIGLRFGAQYASQRSNGEDLLTGHSFSTDQFGLKGEVVLGSALLTAAYTGTGGGADMQSPWGAYPGYTSVQIENFYRAGEKAEMLRAAYNFPQVRGLSAYGLYVHGSQPESPKQYPQDEYDLNVQWDAGPGKLKGLTLRARYGHVAQDSSGNPHQDDFRLMLFYQLR
ncbi:putative Outer membrane porin, OprD family [Burkholderiales bacterium]|nr:putative Outer membrane porin, OprD family [Burkholderiales bacterium]